MAPDNRIVLNSLDYNPVEQDKDLDKALQMIQKAVNSEPTNGNYLDSLGWAYFKLGRFEEAVRQLKEAAKRVPQNAVIEDHLDDAYMQLGKRSDAKATY